MGQRWRTSLTHIEPNRILVRGYPLDETMGRVSFGDTIHLLLTGDLPTPPVPPRPATTCRPPPKPAPPR